VLLRLEAVQYLSTMSTALSTSSSNSEGDDDFSIEPAGDAVSNWSVATIESTVDSESGDVVGDLRRSSMIVITQDQSLMLNELSRVDMAPNRMVRFDSVEIREYEYTLGEHPGVRVGPPLTISWDAISSSILPLDEYEKNRLPRRPDFFLKKTKEERWKILKNAGFVSEDLHAVVAQVVKAQSDRNESAKEVSELQAMINESRRLKKLRQEKKKKKSIFNLFRRQRKPTNKT
jgi:hypothetical protein